MQCGHAFMIFKFRNWHKITHGGIANKTTKNDSMEFCNTFANCFQIKIFGMLN